MINLMNLSYEDYIRKYNDYKIICIGAGGTLKSFLLCHMEKLFLLRNIEYILDNNESLEGNEVQVLNRMIRIQYLPKFRIDKSTHKWVVFLLVSERNIIDVVNQLDSLTTFSEMDCVIGLGTLRWGYTFFPRPKHRMEIDWNCDSRNKIPAIIHYCWFGKNEMPESDRLCIDSFKRYNPDYKIIKWSEDNFDISSAPRYVQDAYEHGKYAFVSDYVRLFAVYKYGGIYLDTDVELFSNLDFILKYRMMFAYMEYGELATGLGFAAEMGSHELKEMMQMYDEIPFVFGDGSLNLTPCPRYTNEYFRRKGITLDNSLEINDDILFLSSDFLCPMTPIECSDGSYQLAEFVLTENTVGIHWCNNSWKDEGDLKVFNEIKIIKKAINDRLLADWKRQRGM